MMILSDPQKIVHIFIFNIAFEIYSLISDLKSYLFSATLFSSSLQQQHLVPPPPLAIIPSSSIINHQQNQVRQQQLIELSEIPPPKELDLSSIPKPRSLRLDEIRMPPEGTKIKIPKSKVELIELVAANGDGYEENLVTKCNKDDFDSQLK